MQNSHSHITHLNSATLSPYYPKLTGIVWCILLEHSEGYLLVDAGLGTGDFERPRPMMRLFEFLLRIKRDPSQAIVNQINAMGLQSSDIKHIVLTHTHLDHAGGLPDFPHAQIHVFAEEYNSLDHPRSLLDHGHINAHFTHNPNWIIHNEVDTTWFGFDAITALPGILLIPLPGHTSGHCGVAIQTQDGWLLHAGDAISPFHAASDPDGRGASHGYPMNWLPTGFTHWALGNHAQHLANLINEHSEEVTIVSAHDSIAFEQLTGEAA